MVQEKQGTFKPHFYSNPTDRDHATPIGGHFGFHKILTRIKQDFSWPNMHRTVKELLQQCDNCQRFKIDCMATPTFTCAKTSMD